jgi:hypothetical protein
MDKLQPEMKTSMGFKVLLRCSDFRDEAFTLHSGTSYPPSHINLTQPEWGKWGWKKPDGQMVYNRFSNHAKP